ncbi:AAA family ATPase [Frateuria hangzhouensis]|uniref:AAA family ATPase n=1 Tax=Frateuria hangzhouensis TaxID=2995589 RepID=UPI0022609FEA|nr:AAA family ATPase [Frateuria sp. STR12]MCX7514995.1 AAA family ATPase [Frateuria sp. STR12]
MGIIEPQWKRAVDAAVEAGRPITAAEVCAKLGNVNPKSILRALKSACVNDKGRTHYQGGAEPRRTDAGHPHDRLFRQPDRRYVPYDPKVHGVWEVYSDPASTSSHKTSVRELGKLHPTMTVTLTNGAVKPGNTFFPIKAFDEDFFPPSMIRAKDPDAPAVPARFTTDAGTEFHSDVYRSSPNSGYLHNRAAASGYYLATGARGGDRLRIERMADDHYHITLLPAAVATAASPEQHVSEPKMPMPINKILFGPPGTGKTYHTVNEALYILDPAFLAAHETDRAALKQRFDALVQAGFIRFVTFHQSFSYEDFVEGIRANRDEPSGALSYDVEDGVFKQICEAARSRNIATSGPGIGINGRSIWKVSLGDSGTEGHIFDECMAKGMALLGFGSSVDLTGVSSRAEIVERLQAVDPQIKSSDYTVTALDLFIRRVKVGDLIVVSQGNLKFRAIGEVTGGYVHVDRGDADSYAQGRPVRWLRQYEPARPYTDLMENRFSQMTIYEPRPGTINLDRLASLLAPEQAHEPEPRVLIIDEINRGNISRIFGELITLIEPSKRAGCPEALEVTLPYSKDRFSVPRNVHLIGTMNTADRSLAGLDVALRRRFEFVEMRPDPSALAGVVVNGIPVDALLATMNRRIEMLLGRDYMLGHAYFMNLKDDPSLERLAEIFRRQVLPLLQEYFFEDWQKIAWVLNDHRKSERALCFLQQAAVGIAELLGDKVELPGEGHLWALNNDAFANPKAYLEIIKADQVPA